jgi:N-acetylglucosamine malate deacetylase 1
MAKNPVKTKTKEASSTLNTNRDPSCDFMVIGAHADDIEIHVGGTVAKLVAQGHHGVLVDLTDASAGTRGTPELRLQEAAAAATVLGVARDNLGLPDGCLVDSLEAQFELAALMRRYRPRILLTHSDREDHPDHRAASLLVEGAAFRSGLSKLPIPGEAWRPQRIFHWVGLEPPTPDFAVDITEYWPQKLKAIACYGSQFHNPKAGKPAGQQARKSSRSSDQSNAIPGGKTDIATPAFLEALEYRARYFGARIKRRYAEAFTCRELPEIHDLTALGGLRFP